MFPMLLGAGCAAGAGASEPTSGGGKETVLLLPPLPPLPLLLLEELLLELLELELDKEEPSASASPSLSAATLVQPTTIFFLLEGVWPLVAVAGHLGEQKRRNQKPFVIWGVS